MVDEVQEAEVVTEQAATPKEYTFTVTLDEANLILGGLGELPAKLSLGVIQKLQNQAATQ